MSSWCYVNLMSLWLHASQCQQILHENTGIKKMVVTDAESEWSPDDLAADDHLNSALLSNYGVMWVILSEHVDSRCLLIHSKQTQLGVGRQRSANWDRACLSFTLSPLMSGFFKKPLSITLSSPSLFSLIFPPPIKESGPSSKGASAGPLPLLIHPLGLLYKSLNQQLHTKMCGGY